MHSDDRTVEIAKRFGANVFTHDRVGYVEPARNYAISKALGDWILILDADERLSLKSIENLSSLFDGSAGEDAYYLPRRNNLLGRWMKGTRWGTDVDLQLRLFRKNTVTWSDEIHSTPSITGVAKALKEEDGVCIDHWNMRDAQHFIEKLNQYTTQEAKTLKKNSATWDAQQVLNSVVSEFTSRYEPHKDGVHSFILSGLMAFYRFAAWAKYWEELGRPNVKVPVSSSELFSLFNQSLGSMLKESETALTRAQQINDAVKAQPKVEAYQLSGFHGDEGGWRWMEPIANIHIVPDLKSPKKLVSFSLKCVDPSLYESFPFDVTILVNRSPARKVTFQESGQTFFIDLEVACEKALNIRIETTGQLKRSGGDLRRLSMIFSSFAITNR
jgi:hypothetical protein